MMTLSEQASRYVAVMPLAIAGSGSHKATFNAGVVPMRGFAFPEPLALDVLREWNATHCDLPWTNAAVRHKICDAAKSPRPLVYLLGTRAVVSLPSSAGNRRTTSWTTQAPTPPISPPKSEPEKPLINEARGHADALPGRHDGRPGASGVSQWVYAQHALREELAA